MKTKTETFAETLERVLMDDVSTVFPARSATRGTIEWHQLLPEEKVRDERDFGAATCRSERLEDAVMPQRLRFDLEPKLCEVCARYGTLRQKDMAVEVRRLMDLIRTARVVR